MENVLVAVSHGFHIRNFFQTNFVRELARTFRVVALIEKTDAPHLKKMVGRLGMTNVEVVGVSIRPTKIETGFNLLRKNIFVSPKRANSRSILNEMNSSSLGKWKVVFRFFNVILGSFEATRALWRRVESLFVNGRELDYLFSEFKPCLVVSADYGTKPFEIRLIRAARRCSIKSLAIVPSWDNLTSKGVIAAKPDYLAVWNATMAEEAVSLHAFAKKRIHVVGALQFDPFFDGRPLIPDDEFRKRFDIDRERPIIIFGTITPKYFKYNLDILKILKESIESGQIAGNPKILVRIHPQVVKDPVHGDDLDAFYTLAAGNRYFCFSVPEIEDWGSMQVPHESDLSELIAILEQADICLSSASTLIFDSFACKTPFIGIGFDGYDADVPPHKSVRRMFEFEHYRHVTELGGFRIAESREQLVQQINDYMRSPETHAEERVNTLREQIQFLDGRTYERLGSIIRSIHTKMKKADKL